MRLGTSAAAGALFALLAVSPACGALRDDPTGEAVSSAVAAVAEAAPAVEAAAVAVDEAVRADAALADRAREIIRPSCGSCHTASSPKADPKALAIYDLERPDWGATMSRAQLGAFQGRIAGKKDLTEADRPALEAYVQALLARAPK